MTATSCPVCRASMPTICEDNAEMACPRCGLVWTYGTQPRPTPESVRALVAREREAAAQGRPSVLLPPDVAGEPAQGGS